MGSIGDVFPYAAPVNGTTGWANWILCMDELITRVSSPVPISALSGTNLNMDDNEITSVKDIVFTQQSSIPTTTPGGMYFYNGEWYLVTTTGAIQVTVGGILNVTVNGGIGGDYGGINPAAVRFVDADHRYDFYDNYGAGEWGYVRGLGVDIAAGTTSALKARIIYAGAGNLTFTLPPTVPAAGNSILQIDDTGAITQNRSTGSIANTVFLAANVDLKVGGVATIFGVVRWCVARQLEGTGIQGSDGVQIGVGDGTNIGLPDLTYPGKLNSVKLSVYKADATASTYTLYKRVFNAAAVSLGTVGSSAAGTQTLTITPAVQTVALGTTYHINYVGVAAGDKVNAIYANCDLV